MNYIEGEKFLEKQDNYQLFKYYFFSAELFN